MPKCSFCGKNYENPKGVTLVKVDGTIKHLCSSKCRNNLKLGRDPRKVTWIRKSVESRIENEGKKAEIRNKKTESKKKKK
jgi:large subunit ribosomal protein L24e